MIRFISATQLKKANKLFKLYTGKGYITFSFVTFFMIKNLLAYLICLSSSACIYAQDTLTFAELSSIKKTLNGNYVIIDGYKNIITAFEFNGQYIVDTIKGKSPYYQVGKFASGKKQGIWKMYITGVKQDTLFGEWEWKNDTIIKQTSFDRKSGTPDIVRTYNNTYLINESRFVRNGIKYSEVNYLFCIDRDTNFSAISIGYHSNGVIRSIHKSRADYSTGYKVQLYGTGYDYTRKGKLWQTVNYDGKYPYVTRKIRRSGKQYEWYNKKY
jgi:hypothetical protein